MVSPRDFGPLLAYRLRPLDPPTLIGAVAAAVVLGTWMIPSAPPPPPEILGVAQVTTPLALVALALSLAAGFVGGRDVDVAERLLFSAPSPHWRVLLLRVALWGAVSASIVWALASRGEAALDLQSHPLRSQALVHLLFGTSLVVALSRSAGPLIGGGLALAAFLTLAGGSLVYEGFPLHVLADATSPEWRVTAVRLEVAAVALLVATFWSLRRTSRA